MWGGQERRQGTHEGVGLEVLQLQVLVRQQVLVVGGPDQRDVQAAIELVAVAEVLVPVLDGQQPVQALVQQQTERELRAAADAVLREVGQAS